jgi:hypothetical protein
MKQTIVLAASVSLAWVLCSPLPVNAEDVPRRKAGLWEITTIGAGSGTSKARTCIGENDRILTPEGGNCAEPKVASGGEDTTIVDVVCTTDQGKETISGAFTGDFGTRYRAQVKITFDPPPQGMLPHMGVSIDGKYLGPDCGAENAPGEAP